MDNLTHSLVGALIGQAGLKKKTGLAMPALIIGANIPDIDASCTIYGIESLAMRRGLTHGPIAWVILPLVLAGLLYGWDHWQAKRVKRPEGRLPVHFGWLFALAFIATLTHPALDWLNTYGIRLLEPFSHRWFYGDAIFIIDLWLWLGMGFATWLSVRREKRHGNWRAPAQIALAAVGIYITSNIVITRVHSLAHPPFAETISAPVPLAFWKRETIGVIRKGRYIIDGKEVGDFDLSDKDLADIAAANDEARAFLFWSRLPLVEYRDGQFLLLDARFYDPLAASRFSVVLPERSCEGLGDE